jgi:hypothetical protein
VRHLTSVSSEPFGAHLRGLAETQIFLYIRVHQRSSVSQKGLAEKSAEYVPLFPHSGAVSL